MPNTVTTSEGTHLLEQWSLIVAVKDEGVLRSTLLRSPDIDSRCELIMKYGCGSAAQAYNEGAAVATSEILVFAHTDVYLPSGWLAALARSLDTLNRSDPDWGVLGVCGRSISGEIAGHVYSTGSRKIFGRPFDEPVETLSLDELLLITRRSASLRFDEQLGFHLYGTDVCYESRQRSMRNYIISAFCIHNSNGIRNLPFAFWRAYFYIRRKWWNELPIHSCCAEVTRSPRPFIRGLGTALRQLIMPSKNGTRSPDPEQMYRDLLAPRDDERPQVGSVPLA